MEEIVNGMNAELEASLRVFRSQAAEVASLDTVLRSSGAALGKLDAELHAAQSRQQSLDQSLQDIETEQAALSANLDRYEATLESAQKKGPFASNSLGSSLTDVDAGLANAERERAYVHACPHLAPVHIARPCLIVH